MSRRIEIEITSLNGDVATCAPPAPSCPRNSQFFAHTGDRSLVIPTADVEQYMEGIEIFR